MSQGFKGTATVKGIPERQSLETRRAHQKGILTISTTSAAAASEHRRDLCEDGRHGGGVAAETSSPAAGCRRCPCFLAPRRGRRAHIYTRVENSPGARGCLGMAGL